MGDLNVDEKKSARKKFGVVVSTLCDFCKMPIFSAPVVDKKAGYHKRKKNETIYAGQRARKTYHQGSCAFEAMGKKKRKLDNAYKIARDKQTFQTALELVFSYVILHPKQTRHQILRRLRNVDIKESQLSYALKLLKDGEKLKRRKGMYVYQVPEAKGKKNKAA